MSIVRHKYNAIRTEVDGIKFGSKSEAKYYSVLKERQAVGEVLFFLRQVPFHLPGGVRYVCDFAEFHADGSVHFVDVKGRPTAMFTAKKKQVEDLYSPVVIELAKWKARHGCFETVDQAVDFRTS